MPRTTPEQVETLHQLINEATNAASAIAEVLACYGDFEEDPEPEMAVRVRSTKALLVRDGLVALLDSLNNDPS
jgi:hypothetical protein